MSKWHDPWLETQFPSWLTSWVAWRNHFTPPGSYPFSDLREQLEHKHLPLHQAFDDKYDDFCPYCMGQFVVKNERFGTVYCICEVLKFMQRTEDRYEDIRSEAYPALLGDMEMRDEYTPLAKKRLQQAIDLAEQFIKKPDFWYVLSGRVGTGKTHILRAINAQMYPMSVYITSRDLEDLVHKYRQDDNVGELYKLLRYAPVLLIDDLGMEFGGPWMGSQVDRVLDARYARYPEYPVVVSTNMELRELTRYLVRAGDRLGDTMKVKDVQLSSVSYRSLQQ